MTKAKKEKKQKKEKNKEVELPKETIKKTTRVLAVKFTPEEMQNLHEELANKTIELRQKEEAKKAAVSSMKSELDALQSQTKSLADKIRAKEEYRPVDCHIRFHWKEGQKQTVRLDTGECVDINKISDDERQQVMFELEEEKQNERDSN